ncbi:MAG TPA: hypothetical protein P5572_02340 [Phycisphaerae bacterium]|nr:hypothetical protein [Phycisphaerae bacterium]
MARFKPNMPQRDRVQPILEHLAMVAYFERVPAHPGQLLAQCSEILHRLFGNRKYYVHGMVHVPGQDRLQKHHQSLRLGETLVVDVDAACIESLCAYAPAPRARRFPGYYEAMWDITFEPNQVYLGLEHGPVLRVGISLEQIKPDVVARLAEVAVEFAALVAECDTFTCGFCDVGDYRDTVLGRMYGGAWQASANFRSQLRRMVWTRAGDERLHLARDVFWGNIFGTRMLEKLGGAEWLQRYEAIGPGDERLVYPFAHGTLLLIADHVKHVRYGPASPSMWTLQRASYLYAELARARLLCGMQGPCQGGWS